MIGAIVRRLLRVPCTPVDAPAPPASPTRWQHRPVHAPAMALMIGGAATLLVAQLGPGLALAIDEDLAHVRTALATETGDATLAVTHDGASLGVATAILRVRLVRPATQLVVTHERWTHTHRAYLGETEVAWGATELPCFHESVRAVHVVHDEGGTHVTLETWTERDVTFETRDGELVIGVAR